MMRRSSAPVPCERSDRTAAALRPRRSDRIDLSVAASEMEARAGKWTQAK